MIQGFSSGLIGNRELIYETDLPSFQRDFASLKTLDHGYGPSITFTRASNATFFDANGVLQTAGNNVPRFDHDPATGASSLGLLIEEQRTNNFQRSAEFDNAYWAKTNASVTANSATAPDGTASADTFVEDTTASAAHALSANTASLSPTSSVTASIFAKAKEREFLRLTVWDADSAGNNASAVFNLTSGTVSLTGTGGNATGVTGSIKPVGNGWYRCSVSAVPNTSGTKAGLGIYVGTSSTAFTYTGDGTSGLYLWGAQIEAGAFPTSYIPTTTATATRSADSAVVTPISSFYNQSEGTLFGEYGPSSRSQVIADFNDNSINNRLALLTSNTSVPRAVVVLGSSTQFDSSIGSSATSGTVKFTAAVKVDDFQAARGGTLGTADTGGTPPASLTHLRIGSAGNGAGVSNSHIRKIAYWPKRLSNTLLQQLTT